MKQLINKIASAKAEIKNSPLKKEGKNSFSNYEYFTPSQIEYLVANACHNNGLLTTFDLIRNDLGVFGKLTIYDTETGESLSTEMATAIPEIKATNIAQQFGGCVTYTERYLKMSFFGITDNKLDFDTTENTEKQSKEAAKKVAEVNALEFKVTDLLPKIKACTEKQELTDIFNSNKELQGLMSFKTALNNKHLELEKQLSKQI